MEMSRSSGKGRGINVVSADDVEAAVIGFVDVAASSSRIFFGRPTFRGWLGSGFGFDVDVDVALAMAFNRRL